MSSKTVNIRYGIFMLVTMIVAVLTRCSTHDFSHDSVNIIMMLVCIVWFNTIRYRIIIPELRRLLSAMSVMLTLLFIITIGRYTIFKELPLISRYLNYLYQIPVLSCTMLSFYSALCIGKAEPLTVIHKHKWMALLCIMLVTGYLTNDLHRMAYRTILPSGGLSGHFVVCFLSWAYQAVTIGVSFIMILRCSRISKIRKYAWLPVFFLITGLFMLILTTAYGHITIGRLNINFQPVFAYMIIGFWESCIIIGLVPSNSRYLLLIDHLPINMQITDRQGNVRFDSAKPGITDEQRQDAISGSVMLDGYRVLRSRIIPGGYAFWTEDRSKIQKLNDDLRKRTDDLRYKNELLSRENRIKEDTARYEVRRTIPI